MSKNYFIGDCHFSHNDIHKKFRTNFSSDEEHDNIIYENIMACAGKRNQLWLLGDVFFKSDSFWRLDEFSKHFQNVNYLLGNHCNTGISKYAAQLDNVHIFGIQSKYGMWISHAPVHPDELRGRVSVHGHTHNILMLDINKEIDKRYYCVSCEQVDYRPISLAQIKEERGWK